MSKAVKAWEQAVRDFGVIVEGSGAPELHHVVGRTYKQDKLLVGPWFVLLLPWQYHGTGSGDPCNVTHFRRNFTARFGLQRDLFAGMVKILHNEGVDVPPIEILKAIEATDR